MLRSNDFRPKNFSTRARIQFIKVTKTGNHGDNCCARRISRALLPFMI